MENINQIEIDKKIKMTGIVFVILTAVSIVLTSLGQSIFMFLVYALMVSFSIYHSSKRYGLKLSLIFLGLVTVISWSYESLSILTGFPFGHYHYSKNFYGPWVGLVPFMIMPAYYAMGYFSWTIGNVLLDKKDSLINGADLILLPLLSSFVMVMWDLSFDPMAATIGKLWVWHSGGSYFGVPFSNFLGWFLCVFTFYFIFALILRFTQKNRPVVTIAGKTFWILPALMYLTRTIQYVLNVFTRQNIQVVSKDTHIWWTADIYWSLLLVSIFTMMFIVFYSAVRIIRN